MGPPLRRSTVAVLLTMVLIARGGGWSGLPAQKRSSVDSSTMEAMTTVASCPGDIRDHGQQRQQQVEGVAVAAPQVQPGGQGFSCSTLVGTEARERSTGPARASIRPAGAVLRQHGGDSRRARRAATPA